MLALPHGDSDNNIVYDSFNLCRDYFKKIEPAGKFFEELIKLRGENSLFNEFHADTSKIFEVEEEDTEIYDWEKEYYEKMKNNPISAIAKEKENFYQLLGIEDLFLKATVDDIRKAFKKSTIKYHPDKNKTNASMNGDKEDEKKDEDIDNPEEKVDLTEEQSLKEEDKKKDEINQKWLRIKEAYETLLDPEKRKKYDSTFDFDDEIPEPKSEKMSEELFFREFGPCFIKNSVWSKRKPVPKLGDKKTPIEKLKKFYQFWFNFDSWRDFSVDGEYNLEGNLI